MTANMKKALLLVSTLTKRRCAAGMGSSSCPYGDGVGMGTGTMRTVGMGTSPCPHGDGVGMGTGTMRTVGMGSSPCPHGDGDRNNEDCWMGTSSCAHAAR